MIKRTPEQCELCALMEHDAYICARWRLAYAVNRLINGKDRRGKRESRTNEHETEVVGENPGRGETPGN